MLKFRYLTADEVECRVNTINEKGLTLLLYKDARCDMRILDETVGAEDWQREHYECKGNLFCRVGIRAVDGWVWKSDCGTESYTEKEKGEASDSFKRACVNWGIGRELYTAPLIYIPATSKDGTEMYKPSDKNGKPTTYDRFIVTCMVINNGKITGLNIENARTRRTVFMWGNIFPPDQLCEVCGKAVNSDFAEKSRAANDGKVYCSKTCKNKVMGHET